MQALLAEYLLGHLESKGDAQWAALSVQNQLEIPVSLRMVMPTGQLSQSNINAAPGQRSLLVVPVNWYLLVTGLDGSILCVLEPPGIEARPPVVVSTLDMSLPGDIGPIPDPTEAIPVPPDTPSILVGGAQVRKADGTPTCYVVRSQYWKRSGESITIVAGEKLTTGHTSMSGTTESSSDSATVAKSLSMSATASWGPLSTSINASLSSSTTVTHQFEAAGQQTRHETHEYSGPSTGSGSSAFWLCQCRGIRLRTPILAPGPASRQFAAIGAALRSGWVVGGRAVRDI